MMPGVSESNDVVGLYPKYGPWLFKVCNMQLTRRYCDPTTGNHNSQSQTRSEENEAGYPHSTASLLIARSFWEVYLPGAVAWI